MIDATMGDDFKAEAEVLVGAALLLISSKRSVLDRAKFLLAVFAMARADREFVETCGRLFTTVVEPEHWPLVEAMGERLSAELL